MAPSSNEQPGALRFLRFARQAKGIRPVGRSLLVEGSGSILMVRAFDRVGDETISLAFSKIRGMRAKR